MVEIKLTSSDFPDIPLVAAIPKITDENVRQEYPSSLRLLSVQIIHRHGHRTPLQSMLTEFISPIWRKCHMASYFPMYHTMRLASLRQPTNLEHSNEDQEEKLRPHAHGGGVTTMYRKVMFDTSLWDEANSAIISKDGTEGDRKRGIYGVCAQGHLTDIGREHMENFGKSLRELYIDRLQFLEPTLESESELFVRSTDYPRTFESVHSVLHGLYPPSSRVMSEPIHIYTRTPASQDNMYADYDCKRWKTLRKEFHATSNELIKKEIENSPPAVKKLLEKTKGDPALLFDVLSSAIANNQPIYDLPLNKDDFENIYKLSCMHWLPQNGSPHEEVKLAIGRFVHELNEVISHHVSKSSPSDKPIPFRWFSSLSLDSTVGEFKKNYSMHWDRLNSDDQPPKLSIYSGHDTTLSPLLMALGVFQRHWPPFGSNITIELFNHKTSPTDHYIRVKYNQRAVSIPVCAEKGNHYEGDTSLCRFGVFWEMIKKMVVTKHEYKTLCNADNSM